MCYIANYTVYIIIMIMPAAWCIIKNIFLKKRHLLDDTLAFAVYHLTIHHLVLDEIPPSVHLSHISGMDSRTINLYHLARTHIQYT